MTATATLRPNRLKALRAAVGLTQQQLAAESGVKLQTITRTEQGRGNPRLENAVKLARALGVTLADLFPAERAS